MGALSLNAYGLSGAAAGRSHGYLLLLLMLIPGRRGGPASLSAPPARASSPRPRQLHGSSLQRTLPHVVSMSSRLPVQHQAELAVLDYGSPARRSSSGRRIGQLELRDGHRGGG
jgi:hypothetical protein